MKPTHVVLHCSDSVWGDVEEIRRWHTLPPPPAPPPNGNGWDSIGYHYVIHNAHPRSSVLRDDAFDGTVATGVPEGTAGTHAIGYNTRSIGICLIGKRFFTPKQFDALDGLCRLLMAKYGIPVECVIGHRETEHERGKGKAGKTCPNFDVEAFRERLRRSP